MTSVQNSILKTLAYADIFDYPLTAKEILYWLINPPPKFKPLQSKPLTLLKPLVPRPCHKKLGSILLELEKQKIIENRNNFFFLKNRQKLVKTRLAREKIGFSKIQKARKTALFLAKIPTIQMIALTGSLAMNNAKKESDIDLMIVTRSNTLWITRAIVVGILKLKGLYPQNKRIENQICTNIFLDQKYLSVPKQMRSLYTAHEVLQAKPLYDRGEIYKQYLKANKWTSSFLPNACRQKTKNKKSSSFLLSIAYYLLSLFEPLAYAVQLKYMSPGRRQAYRLTKTSAYLHLENLSKKVLSQYQSKISQLNISQI